jgi:hypothetical protein
MYLYFYEIKYYDEFEAKILTRQGATFGDTYNDAVTHIINYYGENNIEILKMEYVSESSILVFDSVEQYKELKEINHD